MSSLDNEHARTQAKYELDRALDFGGEADLAAWARKWGPAALEASADLIDKADPDQDRGF